MMKQYVYTGSQQGDLNDQQNWEEHLEIPMLRLVVEHLHGALEASVNSQYIGVWHVTHSLIDSIL